MSDPIERFSYLTVLSSASVFWFSRLAFGRPLSSLVDVSKISKVLLTLVERMSFVAVVGAAVVLCNQYLNGVDMDGMSGIDIGMCTTRRLFRDQYQ